MIVNYGDPTPFWYFVDEGECLLSTSAVLPAGSGWRSATVAGVRRKLEHAAKRKQGQHSPPAQVRTIPPPARKATRLRWQLRSKGKTPKKTSPRPPDSQPQRPPRNPKPPPQATTLVEDNGVVSDDPATEDEPVGMGAPFGLTVEVVAPDLGDSERAAAATTHSGGTTTSRQPTTSAEHTVVRAASAAQQPPVATGKKRAERSPRSTPSARGTRPASAIRRIDAVTNEPVDDPLALVRSAGKATAASSQAASSAYLCPPRDPVRVLIPSSQLGSGACFGLGEFADVTITSLSAFTSVWEVPKDAFRAVASADAMERMLGVMQDAKALRQRVTKDNVERVGVDATSQQEETDLMRQAEAAALQTGVPLPATVDDIPDYITNPQLILPPPELALAQGRDIMSRHGATNLAGIHEVGSEAVTDAQRLARLAELQLAKQDQSMLTSIGTVAPDLYSRGSYLPGTGVDYRHPAMRKWRARFYASIKRRADKELESQRAQQKAQAAAQLMALHQHMRRQKLQEQRRGRSNSPRRRGQRRNPFASRSVSRSPARTRHSLQGSVAAPSRSDTGSPTRSLRSPSNASPRTMPSPRVGTATPHGSSTSPRSLFMAGDDGAVSGTPHQLTGGVGIMAASTLLAGRRRRGTHNAQQPTSLGAALAHTTVPAGLGVGGDTTQSGKPVSLAQYFATDLLPHGGGVSGSGDQQNVDASPPMNADVHTGEVQGSSERDTDGSQSDDSDVYLGQGHVDTPLSTSFGPATSSLGGHTMPGSAKHTPARESRTPLRPSSAASTSRRRSRSTTRRGSRLASRLRSEFEAQQASRPDGASQRGRHLADRRVSRSSSPTKLSATTGASNDGSKDTPSSRRGTIKLSQRELGKLSLPSTERPLSAAAMRDVRKNLNAVLMTSEPRVVSPFSQQLLSGQQQRAHGTGSAGSTGSGRPSLDTSSPTRRPSMGSRTSPGMSRRNSRSPVRAARMAAARLQASPGIGAEDDDVVGFGASATGTASPGAGSPTSHSRARRSRRASSHGRVVSGSTVTPRVRAASYSEARVRPPPGASDSGAETPNELNTGSQDMAARLATALIRAGLEERAGVPVGDGWSTPDSETPFSPLPTAAPADTDAGGDGGHDTFTELRVDTGMRDSDTERGGDSVTSSAMLQAGDAGGGVASHAQRPTPRRATASAEASPSTLQPHLASSADEHPHPAGGDVPDVLGVSLRLGESVSPRGGSFRSPRRAPTGAKFNDGSSVLAQASVAETPRSTHPVVKVARNGDVSTPRSAGHLAGVDEMPASARDAASRATTTPIDFQADAANQIYPGSGSAPPSASPGTTADPRGSPPAPVHTFTPMVPRITLVRRQVSPREPLLQQLQQAHQHKEPTAPRTDGVRAVRLSNGAVVDFGPPEDKSSDRKAAWQSPHLRRAALHRKQSRLRAAVAVEAQGVTPAAVATASKPGFRDTGEQREFVPLITGSYVYRGPRVVYDPVGIMATPVRPSTSDPSAARSRRRAAGASGATHHQGTSQPERSPFIKLEADRQAYEAHQRMEAEYHAAVEKAREMQARQPRRPTTAPSNTPRRPGSATAPRRRSAVARARPVPHHARRLKPRTPARARLATTGVRMQVPTTPMRTPASSRRGSVTGPPRGRPASGGTARDPFRARENPRAAKATSPLARESRRGESTSVATAARQRRSVRSRRSTSVSPKYRGTVSPKHRGRRDSTASHVSIPYADMVEAGFATSPEPAHHPPLVPHALLSGPGGDGGLGGFPPTPAVCGADKNATPHQQLPQSVVAAAAAAVQGWASGGGVGDILRARSDGGTRSGYQQVAPPRIRTPAPRVEAPPQVDKIVQLR